MVIKNFSFICKKTSSIILICSIAGILSACQVLQSKKDSPKDNSNKSMSKDLGKRQDSSRSTNPTVLTPSATSTSPAAAGESPLESKSEPEASTSEELTSDELPIENNKPEFAKPTEPSFKKSEIKLGIILGPGAVRSYTHIGVMKELAKGRLAIKAITGFEFGAVVASIYAKTTQPYDMEWQMMKLKEEQFFPKSLLGGNKSADPESFKDFFVSIFQNQMLDDLKIPVACSSLQVNKQQIQLIKQGVVAYSLLRCLSVPPMLKPYQQQISAVTDVKGSVDFLKSKGANYIIFIDLLNGQIPEADWSWALIHQSMMSNVEGVDLIVQVPLQDISFYDFSKRRELIQRGSVAGQSIIQKIYKKFDL